MCDLGFWECMVFLIAMCDFILLLMMMWIFLCDHNRHIDSIYTCFCVFFSLIFLGEFIVGY